MKAVRSPESGHSVTPTEMDVRFRHISMVMAEDSSFCRAPLSSNEQARHICPR